MIPDLEDFFDGAAQPFKRLIVVLLVVWIGAAIGAAISAVPRTISSLLPFDLPDFGISWRLAGELPSLVMLSIPILLLLVGMTARGAYGAWSPFAAMALSILVASTAGGVWALPFSLTTIFGLGYGLHRFQAFQQKRWLWQIERLQQENARRREELKARGIATFDPEPVSP